MSLGICEQQRPRFVQSDQGLPCPLTESLDTTECIESKGVDDILLMHRRI